MTHSFGVTSLPLSDRGTYAHGTKVGSSRLAKVKQLGGGWSSLYLLAWAPICHPLNIRQQRKKRKGMMRDNVIKKPGDGPAERSHVRTKLHRRPKKESHSANRITRQTTPFSSICATSGISLADAGDIPSTYRNMGRRREKKERNDSR
ncbi:hypothetical protein C0Q70_09063 [Pomacea canaliculata]|uniref:Uncharacterized protein n=1 Tax=Pomacea canaliculata TaxID=400727 RepID=A0A2T7P8T1_POMCA|nr:hypothetical protein C0Q70_09063 [Pomacea canaliculata]